VNKTIVVTGIPGTGKTVVCDFVERLAREAGVEVNVINYGTVMTEILRKHQKEMERDTIRKADIDFQHKLQMEAAEGILEKVEQLKGVKIIDTHMSVNTPVGFLPGLPYHVLQILKPEMFVLIEAKPDEISSRRAKDTNRKRDEALEEMVKQELLFSRLMAAACAVLTGAPIKTVINAEGKQEDAARQILRMIEDER
jgi:adenylate kinase